MHGSFGYAGLVILQPPLCYAVHLWWWAKQQQLQQQPMTPAHKADYTGLICTCMAEQMHHRVWAQVTCLPKIPIQAFNKITALGIVNLATSIVQKAHLV